MQHPRHGRRDGIGLWLETRMNIEWERGLTVHAFDDNGKIIVERSLWDTAALMRQPGLVAPAELEF